MNHGSSPAPKTWQPGQPEPDWSRWSDTQLMAVARTLLGPGCLARLEELEEQALAERRQRKKGSPAAKCRAKAASRRSELLALLSRAASISPRLGPLWGLVSRLLAAALEAARRLAKREAVPLPAEGLAMPQRASQGLLWAEKREAEA